MAGGSAGLYEECQDIRACLHRRHMITMQVQVKYEQI